MLQAILQRCKTNLHTLLELHYGHARTGHGSEDAQAVFAVDAGITSFRLDRIAAEFM